MEVFDKQKQSCLAAADLSRKGSIDSDILSLAALINNHGDMFTLSSCSGRVVLLREAATSTTAVRKAGCEWLQVSHAALCPASVLATLAAARTQPPAPGCVVLKFEPLVLHIQCRDVATARLVCGAAVSAGLRNSGLTVGRGGKVVAAVRSTHGLEVPLTDDSGHDLVSSEYVEFIVNKANGKLAENLKRIEHLEKLLKAQLIRGDKSPEVKETIGPTKEVYRRKNKRNKVKETCDTKQKSFENYDSDFPEYLLFPD